MVRLLPVAVGEVDAGFLCHIPEIVRFRLIRALAGARVVLGGRLRVLAPPPATCRENARRQQHDRHPPGAFHGPLTKNTPAPLVMPAGAGVRKTTRKTRLPAALFPELAAQDENQISARAVFPLSLAPVLRLGPGQERDAQVVLADDANTLERLVLAVRRYLGGQRLVRPEGKLHR